jgi:hypothetical protein
VGLGHERGHRRTSGLGLKLGTALGDRAAHDLVGHLAHAALVDEPGQDPPTVCRCLRGAVRSARSIWSITGLNGSNLDGRGGAGCAVPAMPTPTPDHGPAADMVLAFDGTAGQSRAVVPADRGVQLDVGGPWASALLVKSAQWSQPPPVRSKLTDTDIPRT